MSPNKKYEVLQAIEIAGAIQEVGTVIELPEAEATQHVQLGALKEVEDNGGSEGGDTPAPTAPVTPEGGEGGQATPNVPATPSEPEAGRGEVPNPSAEPAPVGASSEKKPWAGNHVVGGNEDVPMRTPHPDLAGAPKA